MNETQRKTDLSPGFRLFDEEDTLAQTHWLILDPPEGYASIGLSARMSGRRNVGS
jgi:hypothetical protein